MNFLFKTYHLFSRRRELAVIAIFVTLLVVLVGSNAVYADPITAIADEAIGQIIGNILRLLIYVVGVLFSISVALFTVAAQYNTFIDHQAVRLGWAAVRDLSNMFFIVILLVIAFGTIIKSTQYSYKSLLVKFILMAILVNFSDSITGFFIDMSQVVFLTFVNAFIDDAAKLLTFDSALGLGQMLNLGNLQTNLGLIGEDVAGAKIQFWDVLLVGILGIFFLLIATGVILGLGLMLVGRIIALWILLILSPIPYVAGILPATKEFSNKWWSSLGKYMFNAPVMGFFLWLTFSIIADSAASTESIIYTGVVDPRGALSGSTTFYPSEFGNMNSITNFIVVIALLLGGAKIASSVGGLGAKYMESLSTAVPALGGAGLKLYANWKGYSQLGKGKMGFWGAVSPGMWKDRVETWKHWREGLKKSRTGAGRQLLEDRSKDLYGQGHEVRAMALGFLSGDSKFWKEYIEKDRWKTVRGSAAKTEEAAHNADKTESAVKRLSRTLDHTRKKRQEREEEANRAESLEGELGEASTDEAKNFSADDFRDAQLVAEIVQSRIADLQKKMEAEKTTDDQRRELEKILKTYEDRFKSLFEALAAEKKAGEKIANLTVERDELERRIKGTINPEVKKDFERDLQRVKDAIQQAEQERTDKQKAAGKGGFTVGAGSVSDPKEKQRLQEELARQARSQKITKEAAREYMDTSAPGSNKWLSDEDAKRVEERIEKLKNKARELRLEAGKYMFPRSTESLRDYYALEGEQIAGLPKEAIEATDMVSRLNAAIADHRIYQVTALLKKGAMDYNDNEWLNGFGYGSGPEGMHKFRRDILEGTLGLNTQFAQQIMSDINYINENKGHYNTSRMHAVDEKGLFYEQPKSVQAATVANELMKGNSRNNWQNTNRLGLGYEDQRGYHLDLTGKLFLVNNQTDFLYRLPRGEVNPNLAANLYSCMDDIKRLIRAGHLNSAVATELERWARKSKMESGYGFNRLQTQASMFNLV
ncbi:MAG: hypothetical protein HYZ08_00440 [Candidatus Kerfeldbacteria bacterium]|nr:hypothetical protein [Candidatus Kerfeldbacteria bacterium]